MSLGSGKRYLCSERGAERIYKGVWGSGRSSFSVGRLYMHRQGGQPTEELSMLCLFDREAASDLGRRMGLESFAGAVIGSESISTELLGMLVRSGLPYLILKDSIPQELEGRVALLDIERDIIVISPDVDTLNFYADASGQPPTLPAVAAVESRPDGLAYSSDGRSALLAGRAWETAVSDGGGRALIGLVEGLCGVPLTVGLRAPRAGSEGESLRFYRQTEAIYSASVYGSVAVRIEDYRDGADVERALRIMHRVFCDMEQDGREFNGYLPRGLLIDTPIWLWDEPPCAVDLLCFDFDRLTVALLGAEPDGIAPDSEPAERLFRVWERYFSRIERPRRMQAVTGRGGALFEEWRRRAGIDEAYYVR